MAEVFDPIAVMQAFERQRVAFIVIGAVGRVIHGSGELTNGLDVVPSTRGENLRWLDVALEELNARRSDGKPPAVERDLGQHQVLELWTDGGELKLVPTPTGTRGSDDLRRAASREPLGHGVRPYVASLGDHARMLAALNREQDRQPLQTLHRLAELERDRGRARTWER